MKVAVLFLAGFLAVGCCKPKVVVHEVKVPVPVPCPVPDVPPRPVLPVEGLRPDSTEEQVRKAAVATVRVLMDYARQLERCLAPYLPPKEPK